MNIVIIIVITHPQTQGDVIPVWRVSWSQDTVISHVRKGKCQPPRPSVRDAIRNSAHITEISIRSVLAVWKSGENVIILIMSIAGMKYKGFLYPDNCFHQMINI